MTNFIGTEILEFLFMDIIYAIVSITLILVFIWVFKYFKGLLK